MCFQLHQIWNHGHSSPQCFLFSKQWTLEDVLNCCPKPVSEGQHHWSHDQIMKIIVEDISKSFNWAKNDQIFQADYCLHQGWGAAKTQQEDIGRYPDLSSRDWQLLVELQLKFPNYIVVTPLHSGITLISSWCCLTYVYHGKSSWKQPSKGSLQSTQDWHAPVSRQDGGQSVSQIEMGCRSFADVSKMCPKFVHESSGGIN